VNEAPAVRLASGDLYEPYVGRWSRLVARELLDWLGAPTGIDWLDMGCGTGVVAEAIVERCAPRCLAGIDSSAGFLEFARQRLKDTGTELHQADARELPFGAAQFDRVVSGLMLNFVPDPSLAVAEMARVVRPGGEVALYVWDYAGKMELMRRFWDAAAALDPRALDLDEGRRFPICKPESLRRLFEDAGLTEVETRAIDVPTTFRDFDDYWAPFLGGQTPAPAYCMSLTEQGRAALRERLRASLPTQADGSIRLVARAWAVKGASA
jgi:ubiquinone/menaquinone biosynthesis C-methylase UbiE